eukprot:Opistho-2@35871
MVAAVIHNGAMGSTPQHTTAMSVSVAPAASAAAESLPAISTPVLPDLVAAALGNETRINDVIPFSSLTPAHLLPASIQTTLTIAHRILRPDGAVHSISTRAHCVLPTQEVVVSEHVFVAVFFVGCSADRALWPHADHELVAGGIQIHILRPHHAAVCDVQPAGTLLCAGRPQNKVAARF